MSEVLELTPARDNCEILKMAASLSGVRTSEISFMYLVPIAYTAQIRRLRVLSPQRERQQEVGKELRNKLHKIIYYHNHDSVN